MSNTVPPPIYSVVIGGWFCTATATSGTGDAGNLGTSIIVVVPETIDVNVAVLPVVVTVKVPTALAILAKSK